jgi:hypothetical protein
MPQEIAAAGTHGTGSSTPVDTPPPHLRKAGARRDQGGGLVAAKMMVFKGPPEEVSPAPSPSLVEKKKKKRGITKEASLGRFILAGRAQVPTSFIQAQDGVVRSAPRKGSSATNRKGLPAANAGKTIQVHEAFVRAVLTQVAMLDDGVNLVFPSNGYLAKVTGVKIGSVVHALRALTQAGFLRKTSRGFKKSKNYWLNWEVIQYGFEQTFEQTEDTPGPTKPAEPTKPVELDPVTEELLNIMMDSCAALGPIGEALTRRAAQPVVKGLLRLHEAQVLLHAILDLRNWQYKKVVEADVPAAYLTETLKGALAGLTPAEAMRLHRPAEDELEEESL